MNTKPELLEKDVGILEAMVADLPQYLMSDTLHWPLQQGMPSLTLGGCLMRQHRLQALRNKLPPDLQTRLKTAVDQYDEALIEKVVRFETRAHQELHARLGEWADCLRNLQCTGDQYANKVDTRVVIDALITALEAPPYRLEMQVITETNTLDQNLRSRWQPGDFVWDATWQPAYPQDVYWWLYGQPVYSLVQAR